jgi:hypothetical protein
MTIQINFKLMVLLLNFALIFSTTCTNISYGQPLQSGTGNDLLPPSPSSLPSDKEVLPYTGASTTSRAVNITSPTKHQEVPIGKDLTILGTSIGNATSDCQVVIGLNNIKPYQSAIGNGPGGVKDYSKWSFILTSKYATIKQGPDNKITARYKCSSSGNNINSNILLVTSVNVTGTAVTTTTTTSNQLEQQQRQEQLPPISTNFGPSGIPWLP